MTECSMETQHMITNRGKTLHQAFFTQVQQTPEARCLSDGSTVLTYRQTRQQVEHLGHKLQQRGVGPGSVVGIYSDKRFEVVIGFLAVAALGGRCVQLDKSFPQPFLQAVIEETALDLLLCDVSLTVCEHIATVDMTRLCQEKALWQAPEWPEVDPRSPVWLVYSSGTTGRHKGIAISHAAMLFSYDIRGAVETYGPGCEVGCNIYYLWEVFRPMLAGGCSHIIHDTQLYDFQLLADTLHEAGITEMVLTPSYLETLLYTAPEAGVQIFHQLEVCWLNGEVVSNALTRQLAPYVHETRIYNLYSISECHDVAVYRLGRADTASGAEEVLPAGYMLNHVDGLLLDEAGRPVNAGEKGELYIATPGLAEGYVNRPALNRQRFIEPEESPNGRRLYKTGDYAALAGNGRLITVYGRCDYVVKLRGYTLSLPYVEAVIKDKLQVMHCVVKKHGASSASEYLAAYIEVPADHQETFRYQWGVRDDHESSTALVNAIAPYLAPYMVPRAFVLVAEMPLNPYSNKLERHKVGQQESEGVSNGDQQKLYVKDWESYCRVWAQLLGKKAEQLNDRDDFFHLGGTSLLAMQLLAIMRRSGYRRLRIGALLDCSTLAESYELFTGITGESDSYDAGEQVLADVKAAFASLPFNARPGVRSGGAARNILLTGATGLLGSDLLKELLDDNRTRVYCLIRADSVTAAWQRLKPVAQARGIHPATLGQRVKVVPGQINERNLGLEPRRWQRLAREVDAIINTAANVNLLLPYQALKEPCVGGVANLIALCTCYRPYIPFYQVSTNGVLPAALSGVTGVETLAIDDYLPALQCGYARAKWASEKLLQLANQQGVPVSIFRPGNIGAADGGPGNARDMNALIMQAIAETRQVPSGLRIETTPVSHVSRFIGSVVRHGVTDSVYNMTNRDCVSAEALADALDCAEVSYEQWLSTITDPQLTCLLDGQSAQQIDGYTPCLQHCYESAMQQYGLNYPQASAAVLAQWIRIRQTSQRAYG